MKRVAVGGMNEARHGTATVRRMAAEGLGDYAPLFAGPWSPELLARVVSICARHRIRFVMDEMWDRLPGALKKEYGPAACAAVRGIIAGAGGLYDGTFFFCEYGGLGLYWPEATVKGSPLVIPATRCAAEARRTFVGNLRALVRRARAVVPPPLVSIEASAVAKYLFEGGVDRVDLEVTYDRLNELCFSATKGACLAYGRPGFGADMAMVWYGGNEHDGLWRRRWRTSLYHAFIRGADPIYAEHGLMDYRALGKNLGTNAPEVAAFRRTLAGFASFARAHPRPSGFPEARIAVLHGNLDSFALGQDFVWGQRGPAGVPAGSAEDSWKLFDSFYRTVPWEFRYATGERDFSGNPPLGQVDAIPAESPQGVLDRYEALVFLGWNTMTPAIYARLRSYVRSGGRLLCTLAHLDTRTRRDGRFRPVNGGDLRDLFGVAVGGPSARAGGIKFVRRPSSGDLPVPLWTENCDPMYADGGFPLRRLTIGGAEILAGTSDRFPDSRERIERTPVITANRCGGGTAFLVASPEFPGCPGMQRLYGDLLLFLTAPRHADPTVEASDRVRWASYREGEMRVLYLLNTGAGRSEQALVSAGRNRRVPVRLPPGALATVYVRGDAIVIPRSPRNRVTDISLRTGTLRIGLLPGGPPSPLRCRVGGNAWRGGIDRVAAKPRNEH